MAITFSRQTRKFPSSGTTLTRDGAPLSSRIGSDLIVGVNNLAYTMPFAGYVQWFDSLGGVYAAHGAGYMPAIQTSAPAFVNGEYFIAQCPTVVPILAGTRFRWTAGIRNFPSDSSTGDVTIQNINLYLATSPYIGQVVDGPVTSLFEATHTFDTSKLPSKYVKIVNNCNITIPNPTATRTYTLIDGSAGILSWLPGDLTFNSSNNSFLGLVTLILTADLSRSGTHTGEGTIGLDVADFNWWVTPE